MPLSDDVCRASITVDTRVPFQGKSIKDIYICPNGLVCFGGQLQTYSIPTNGKTVSQYWFHSCLAPYFSDLTTFRNGNIYYRYIDGFDNSTSPDIAIAKDVVAKSQDGLDITPTFILVATWADVPHHSSYFRTNYGTVTFQVVYITDGTRGYSFYFYEDGGMTIQTGNVFIGLIVNGEAVGLQNSRDGSFLRRPDINLSIRDCPGQYEYIDTEVVEDSRLICRKWHQRELQFKEYYLDNFARMPRCPCVWWFVFFDRRFQFERNWWFSNGPTLTAYAIPTGRFHPTGLACEYSGIFRSFVRSKTALGSSFLRYNPIFYENLAAEDYYYKQVCCVDSQPDLCHLFYDVRPQPTCYERFPFRFSWAFGDPHITTLDNTTYTFNGHDEYILLNVTTDNFQIQCRTDRAFTADGNISFATVFTAFVISGDGIWLQAELNANRTGLAIYAGQNKEIFDDYSVAFSNPSTTNIEITDDDVALRLNLEKANDTLVTTFTDLGISFNVTLGKKLLQLGIGLPDNLQNQTEGLLGNFNNDTNDEFRPRFSTEALLPNITEGMIFSLFGQTWKTTEDESLFKYFNGRTRANYSTDFIPQFIEDANPDLLANASTTCGNDQQCIFDFVFTGDAEVAAETKSTQIRAESVEEDSSNEAPTIEVTSGLVVIDGQKYLYPTLNEDIAFNVLGNDDGTITYTFLSNDTSDFASIDVETNNSATVIVNLNSTTPQTLSITAVDNKDIYAEAIDVIIVLCSGCSSHGTCDFTVYREDNTTTDTFKLATCVCKIYWEGDDCELDYNGCQDDPCAVGRNCSDKNATIHEIDVVQNNITRPYTCSACPPGYVVDENEKCDDVDECNTTNGNCSQTCTNTEGSFFCSCNTTYRLAADGQSCNDINECDEATSGCDQICNNTVGGFVCECFAGFVYNTSTSNCEQSNNIDAKCDSINCTLAGGCTLNSTDDAVCFCNAGYELLENNTCSDVDECSQNVCSQDCTNFVGGYECTCYTGYQLKTDKITCEECDFPFYGDNCDQTCNCGRGNNGCDNVRGCICREGWTGTNCDNDVDECDDLNICGDVNKVCVNSVGSYRCNCRDGYSLQTNDSCIDTNECLDASVNNCSQLCVNTEGGFTCGCKAGYTIDPDNYTLCNDINECSSGVSGCQQTCVNTKGSFRCECYFGYILNDDDRRTCSEVEDPCTLFPDVNCSDICRVIDQQAVCSCNVGYQLGVNNQSCIDTNECVDPELNLCSEQDSCTNTKGSYSCSCSIGFKLETDGRTCTACDAFHWGENCANNCNCGVGSIECNAERGCVCEAGWSGLLCNIDKDECAVSPSPCTGLNQDCTNTPGSYTCTCRDGYENGTDGNCTNINECLKPSLDLCSQICTDTNGSYVCSCQIGFLRDGNSCTDIDECSGQHGCSQICTNTPGGYRCSCREGWKLELTDRQTCIPASQCTNQSLCGANATCTSINGDDTCECDKGFEFAEDSNTTCIDIKECTIDPDRCSQLCVELEGGYVCVCNEMGFELDSDGSTCKVCDEGKFGANCSETCDCTETNTERCDTITGTCICKEGWNGTSCSNDIDECTEGLDNCTQNSICNNQNGSFSCDCEAGFTKTSEGLCQACSGNTYGIKCAQECECNILNTASCDPVSGDCTCNEGWNGTICTDDVDECANSTICVDDRKTCVNTNGSYSCDCKPEYILSGDNCEDINECDLGTDNCTYRCINQDGSFICGCLDGFSGNGIDCTICENGTYGTNCSQTCACVNSVNNDICDHVTGECSCLSGWEGPQCDIDVDECSLEIFNCTANSTCVNTIGSYDCSCDPGFQIAGDICAICDAGTYGTNCSQNCSCENHDADVCNHVTGNCTCLPGWEGDTCDVDINECVTGTFDCTANSTCINTNGSYVCNCDDGFQKVGELCEVCGAGTFGSNCTQNCPCVNDNTAVDICDHVTGACLCLPTWTGESCEQDVDECETTNICNITNGGCHNFEGGYRCECYRGFINNSGICENDSTITTTPITTQENETQTQMYLVLSFTIPDGDDLSVPSTYERYVNETRDALFAYFNNSMAGQLKGIIIIDIQVGSLKTNCSIVYINTEEASSSLTDAFNELAQNTSIIVFNETVYPLELVIGDITVDLANPPSRCELFNQVTSCQPDFECIEENNAAVCRRISTSDNFGLVIGLSVGLSMLALTIAIVVVAVCYIRKSRKSKTLRTNETDRRREDLFSRSIATRFNSASRRGPVYGAEWYDDASSDASFDVSNRDYQRRWETTQSFANLERFDDGDRVQSNFSWDFLYNYLGPNEKYEIKRPKVDQGINPIYDNNKPTTPR